MVTVKKEKKVPSEKKPARGKKEKTAVKKLSMDELADILGDLTSRYTKEVKSLGKSCGRIIDVKVLITLDQKDS